MIRLTFDRGTLLLRSDPLGPLPTLPGVVWDDRVNQFRAPGNFYREIVTALKASRLHFEDSARFRWGEGLKLPAPTLRSYQASALESWREARGRGVIVLPTGAGKTVVAMAAIARTSRPAICLVPTRILLEQWRERLDDQFRTKIGVLGDGKQELAPILVATFESAYRYMGKLGNRYRLLIIDEIHHFGAGMRDEALEMCIAPFRLGLTATPVTNGEAKKRLTELVGKQVYEATVSELSGRYLAPFRHETRPIDLYPDEREKYETEFGLFRAEFERFSQGRPGARWSEFVGWASHTNEGRRALLGYRRARTLLAFCRGKEEELGRLLAEIGTDKTLIFSADTKSTFEASRRFLIPAVTADIKKTERQEILDKFRRGILTCIISCRVLNEGVDVPDAQIAVIMGGNLGEREHIQRIGRCLRPVPGKVARVIELVAKSTIEVRHWQKRIQTFATRSVAKI